MPDPNTTIRPIGLGASIWSHLRPSTPPTAPATPVVPVAPKPDAFVGSTRFTNPRFSGQVDLAAAAGGRVLRAGASSEGLAAVHAALVDMGFAVPSPNANQYGAQLTQALKNFQASAGLEADGSLGPKTMAALDRLSPAPGKKAWDKGQTLGDVPSPHIAPGKMARVVVSLSQHRAFTYDRDGELTKIYPVRTGKADHADGRGGVTVPGVRLITGKNSDPSDVSNRLWPESGGRAFGDRLIDLTPIDVATGRKISANSGQELHGTDLDSSLGRDFSHGCVGLRNADITEIFAQVRNGEFVRFDK